MKLLTEFVAGGIVRVSCQRNMVICIRILTNITEKHYFKNEGIFM